MDEFAYFIPDFHAYYYFIRIRFCQFDGHAAKAAADVGKSDPRWVGWVGVVFEKLGVMFRPVVMVWRDGDRESRFIEGVAVCSGSVESFLGVLGNLCDFDWGWERGWSVKR